MKPSIALVLAVLALVGCAGRVSYEPSPAPVEAPAESHGETCEVGEAVGLVVESDEPPDTNCPKMAHKRGGPTQWCCY